MDGTGWNAWRRAALAAEVGDVTGAAATGLDAGVVVGLAAACAGAVPASVLTRSVGVGVPVFRPTAKTLTAVFGPSVTLSILVTRLPLLSLRMSEYVPAAMSIYSSVSPFFA